MDFNSLLMPNVSLADTHHVESAYNIHDCATCLGHIKQLHNFKTIFLCSGRKCTTHDHSSLTEWDNSSSNLHPEEQTPLSLLVEHMRTSGYNYHLIPSKKRVLVLLLHIQINSNSNNLLNICNSPMLHSSDHPSSNIIYCLLSQNILMVDTNVHIS